MVIYNVVQYMHTYICTCYCTYPSPSSPRRSYCSSSRCGQSATPSCTRDANITRPSEPLQRNAARPTRRSLQAEVSGSSDPSAQSQKSSFSTARPEPEPSRHAKSGSTGTRATTAPLACSIDSVLPPSIGIALRLRCLSLNEDSNCCRRAASVVLLPEAAPILNRAMKSMLSLYDIFHHRSTTTPPRMENKSALSPRQASRLRGPCCCCRLRIWGAEEEEEGVRLLAAVPLYIGDIDDIAIQLEKGALRDFYRIFIPLKYASLIFLHPIHNIKLLVDMQQDLCLPTLMPIPLPQFVDYGRHIAELSVLYRSCCREVDTCE